jgi:hypothetical protein
MFFFGAKLVKTEKFPMSCVECDKKIESLDSIIDHTNKKHDNNLFIHVRDEQIGGIIEEEIFNPNEIDKEISIAIDHYQKYLKYKQKYLELKHKHIFNIKSALISFYFYQRHPGTNNNIYSELHGKI